MRAVSLLSGGLDSLLSTRIILEQGVEVFAFNSVTVFCTCTPKNSSCSAAQRAVRQLGIPLKTVNSSKEFIEAVKSPRHGYGSHLNPCIDCRIILFRKAAAYMSEIGASFLITGEVLGERPMSQRRSVMKLIEKEAGLEGLVVRPLSAGLLEPSLPEREGWIDRKRLLSIQGRCRKPQIDLANFYKLKNYPCPAGGCRLTEPAFAARMHDLMKYKPDFNIQDVLLLKHGRHLRLSPLAKAVIGRNEEENRKLMKLKGRQDILLEMADAPGPLTLIRGPVKHDQMRLAASIAARYGKIRDGGHVRVFILRPERGRPFELLVHPASNEIIDELRIGPN